MTGFSFFFAVMKNIVSNPRELAWQKMHLVLCSHCKNLAGSNFLCVCITITIQNDSAGYQ